VQLNLCAYACHKSYREGPKCLSQACEFNWYIPMALWPPLMLTAVKAFFNPKKTHLANIAIFTPQPLLFIVHMSLQTWKACLNNLKYLKVAERLKYVKVMRSYQSLGSMHSLSPSIVT
jgi:hypothetical protein